MGSTRRRVTILVLALESIGFVLLAFAVWLAGETRLRCEQTAPGTLACSFEERRLVYLWPFRDATWTGIGGVSAGPADDATRRSIVLHAQGADHRALAGRTERVGREVAELDALRTGGGPPVELVRSDLGWAALAAAFGCLWLVVISLIMREFIGFHTPWWWRLFQSRAG